MPRHQSRGQSGETRTRCRRVHPRLCMSGTRSATGPITGSSRSRIAGPNIRRTKDSAANTNFLPSSRAPARWGCVAKPTRLFRTDSLPTGRKSIRFNPSLSLTRAAGLPASEASTVLPAKKWLKPSSSHPDAGFPLKTNECSTSFTRKTTCPSWIRHAAGSLSINPRGVGHCATRV